MASDGVLVGGAAPGVGGAGVGVTGAPPIVRIGSWLFTESLAVVDSPYVHAYAQDGCSSIPKA